MKKNISTERRYLINRLGFIRNKAGLSARELSQRLGFSPAYIAKFENGDFSIPAEVLLNAITICGSTKEEFFSDNYNPSNQNSFNSKFESLSESSKATIINLIENLK